MVLISLLMGALRFSRWCVREDVVGEHSQHSKYLIANALHLAALRIGDWKHCSEPKFRVTEDIIILTRWPANRY